METEPPPTTSQTDESKAEQIQQDTLRNTPTIPCLADTVLQHHPTIIRLCQTLAACKSSSLSMLANISLTQQANFAELGEPNNVGDAVFQVLAALARKASQKELIMEPLLIFLSQAPQLSEPLLWFVLQVLNTEEALRSFLNAGECVFFFFLKCWLLSGVGVRWELEMKRDRWVGVGFKFWTKMIFELF